MSPKELIAAGYNVELGYKAYIPVEELQDLQEQMPPESNEAYYTRNFFVTQCVLVSSSSVSLLCFEAKVQGIGIYYVLRFKALESIIC